MKLCFLSAIVYVIISSVALRAHADEWSPVTGKEVLERSRGQSSCGSREDQGVRALEALLDTIIHLSKKYRVTIIATLTK